MSMDMLVPRLLAWGMTTAGLGIGLIAAAFVGEYTPVLVFWGVGLVVAGAGLAIVSRLARSKQGD